MSERKEDEVCDVMVVIEDDPGMSVQEAAIKLRGAGLVVSEMDEQNGMVEGTIDACKVKSLQALPFVKYVRNLFTYLSESPEDEDFEADVDDACK